MPQIIMNHKGENCHSEAGLRFINILLGVVRGERIRTLTEKENVQLDDLVGTRLLFMISLVLKA